MGVLLYVVTLSLPLPLNIVTHIHPVVTTLLVLAWGKVSRNHFQPSRRL